jgi:hypothetical protein
MSRQIDHSKPLSDVDRKYLAARGREGEIVHNDMLHGNAEEMSEEEIAAAEQEAMIAAKGKRTPALVDNSLIDEQIEQRRQSEFDQLSTHADMTYAGGYDEDDVNFVASLTDDELRDHLESRTLDTSGTRPEMQKRLLDAINSGDDEDDDEGDDDEGDQDNYDDEQAWTYSALQGELKERGLGAGGSRPELVARLREDNVKRAQSENQG